MILLLTLLLIICIILVFFEESLKDNRAYVFYSLAITLIFVVGLRTVGCDHDSRNYENIFKRSVDFSDSILVESSFLWISNFFHHVWDDVHAVFLLYAIIGISTKFIAITRLSKMWFLPVLIYMGNYLILQDMTQIREGVATGIFLFALRPLVERKYLTYLIWILIASFFHYSSFVLLPLIFLRNNDISLKMRSLFASLVPIGYLIYFSKINLVTILPIPYISEKVEVYQQLSEYGISGDEINVFNLVFIVKIAIYFLLLWKYDLIKLENKYLPIMLKIMGLSIFSYLIFATLPVIAVRISEIYGLVDIFLFCNLFYAIKPKYVSQMVVVIVGVALFSINIFYNGLIE